MVQRSLKHILMDNMGYKILATLMTLILWISVMIRRDFMVTRTLNLELTIPSQFQLIDQTAYEVQIKLEGPRNLLYQYLKNKNAATLFMAIDDPHEGSNNVIISVDKLGLPQGIRLQSLNPNHLRVDLKKVIVK